MKESVLKKSLIHIGLFVLTLATTTLTGAEYILHKSLLGGMTWEDVMAGFPYSLSFLTFLAVHEFGHYFTALYYGVKTSLPYFLPIYFPKFFVNIGTFGAVIRLKSTPKTTRQFFDIGIAGPLAGFVVSVALLVYGFLNLPVLEDYVLHLHPEYIDMFGGVPTTAQLDAHFSQQPGGALVIGTNLLFELLKHTLPIDINQVPPAFELMHYPYLFVGFLTLFFTALNLLPIGQLDGGHVIYGMFGRRHASIVARLTVIALLIMGGTGIPDLKSGATDVIISNAIYLIFLTFLLSKVLGKDRPIWLLSVILGILIFQISLKWAIPTLRGNMLWLLYAFLSTQFIGMDHPSAEREHRVNLPRQILGWIAIAILILCFSPTPVDVIGFGVAHTH